jgi:hypothetical protein
MSTGCCYGPIKPPVSRIAMKAIKASPGKTGIHGRWRFTITSPRPAESDGKSFEYVFVTNEFYPARLMRACDKLAVNAPMFTHVVHISTDAVKATYGEATEATMRRVLEYIDSGRLISLEQWLERLNG